MTLRTAAVKTLTAAFTASTLALAGCVLKEEKEILCPQADGTVFQHSFKGDITVVAINKATGDAQITAQGGTMSINNSPDDYKFFARDGANGEMTELPKNAQNCAVKTTQWRFANF